MPKRGKKRHTPTRTCVGCRETLAKRNLIRIVRTPEGVQVDRTGKIAGRGAYLHDRRSCWETALRGPLEKALKTDISSADLEALQTFMIDLPDE